ncbi:hypothetical protein [Microvirga yunnanensis]|uniref:hypothetical protein n=1 Tax=Microvirga yunnanensis TaxID=2953740 RepID=UPI0021C9A9C3|nr:hypothetical protein [Microvirga sp. HBU67655]
MSASDLLKMFSAPAPKTYKRREGAGWYNVEHASRYDPMPGKLVSDGTVSVKEGKNEIPVGTVIVLVPLTRGRDLPGCPPGMEDALFYGDGYYESAEAFMAGSGDMRPDNIAVQVSGVQQNLDSRLQEEGRPVQLFNRAR